MHAGMGIFPGKGIVEGCCDWRGLTRAIGRFCLFFTKVGLDRAEEWMERGDGREEVGENYPVCRFYLVRVTI